MEQFRVGKEAPDFEAPVYHKGEIKSIKLSDLRGKWVLLFFYPGDFTFVCPTELVAIARKYDEFKKLNTEIVSISVDSPYVHKAWDEHELSKMVEGGIPYPMASDLSGKIGEAYTVFDEKDQVDIRGQFLIDPDGVVQAAEILSAPVGRDVEETLRLIQAFQYVRETGGAEVCPAGWHPGDPTLKPGPDLVGKVADVWKPKD
jgi:peroxiredoxin (alkyl hydroperoxide reductase subunit C)